MSQTSAGGDVTRPTRSPIFVIGTGRSGTTLLRMMLCAHPRIYIAHEPSFYHIESFYSRKAPRRKFLAYYFQSPWFRWLRLDPARVLEGLPDPLPRERMADVYDAIMREKAAQYGRPRYGEKTPAHTAHLARIFADFPGARVVHIVRDPRSVSLSLAEMPWGSGSLCRNAVYGVEMYTEVAKFRDRILQIRFEDLLSDPEATMRQVLEYVGEPWDDAVLDHPAHIPDPNDMPPMPWFERASRPRGLPEARWKSLTPAQIRAIEKASRPIMADAGYEPAILDYEPKALAVWWANVRDTPEYVRCLVTYIRLGILTRDPREFDGERAIELTRRINPSAWALYPDFKLPETPSLLATTSPPSPS